MEQNINEKLCAYVTHKEFGETEKQNAVNLERLTRAIEVLTENSKDTKETLKEQVKTNEETRMFMATFSQELIETKKVITKIEEKTKTIDEEGKVNWRKWISTNWFPFFVGLGYLITSVTSIKF